MIVRNVLVLSEEYDYSTDQVLAWLRYLGCSFDRFDDDADTFSDVFINIGNHSTEVIGVENVSQKHLNLQKYTSIWFRRGILKLNDSPYFSFVNDMRSNLELNKKISKEEVVIERFINEVSLPKKRLGGIEDYRLDKLEQLSVAQSVGLKIPATIVTNSKDRLRHFTKLYDKVICKPIDYSAVFFDADGTPNMGYTELLLEQEVGNLPDQFGYSCFQQYIEKKYEVRVFFIQSQYYAMAIFSQKNPQTKIDFRKYDIELPNRRVPFLLPDHVKIKIEDFRKKLSLDTGSIDIVVTPSLEFVFLEVNPVGQYGMTSGPCNYMLDKLIANYLSNEI